MRRPVYDIGREYKRGFKPYKPSNPIKKKLRNHF